MISGLVVLVVGLLIDQARASDVAPSGLVAAKALYASGGDPARRAQATAAGGYDTALLDAGKSWRYRPAIRKGEPVRYRTFIDIVLKPSDPLR